jgi:AGCS family alanine or glycine:cation symporter
MATLQLWLDRAVALAWGGPLVVVLLATGAYLTFILRGVQVRQLRQALRIGLLQRDEREAEGDLSHFQALMLALGGSIGLGNLVGVAAALSLGGPGALVWLWLAGWLVMATRYAEGVLGVYYREPDRQGRMAGGPMYYLSRGVGGTFGRVLATLFAGFAVAAALGIGASVPGHAAAVALRTAFSVPPVVTGAVLCGVAGAVVAGGIRSIGRLMGVLVPVLVAGYLLAALVVLVLHWDRLDDVALAVARGAFWPQAAAGGLAGASVREAVRWGLGHGVLSAGSGVGTGGIAASTARTGTATTQGLVAMTQTFIDTVVVSAITGLAILAAGAQDGIAAVRDGSALSAVAPAGSVFPVALPGTLPQTIVSLGLAVLALATILAWAHFGERSAEYLLGPRASAPFRGLLLAAVFAGSVASQLGISAAVSLGWAFSHAVSGAMVVPNLVGLLLLSGVVARETTRYQGSA